jgi:membrane-bound inhibitor of C-type lysozyme
MLSTGMLGLAACAGEAPDQEAADAAASEMPEGHPAVEGEAGEQPAAESTAGMEAPHGQVSMGEYTCADGASFTLTVAPGVAKAALRLGDEVVQLDQVETGSGMEFSDGTYTFHGKGPEAFVEKDGEQILTDCQASGHPQ